MQQNFNHTQMDMNPNQENQHLDNQYRNNGNHQNQKIQLMGQKYTPSQNIYGNSNQPEYYPGFKNQPQPIVMNSNGVDGQNSTSSQIQIFQQKPPCSLYILMCPIPCFSIGCCILQTKNLIFNKRTKTATYQLYVGLCQCCADQQIFQFSQIKKLGIKPGYQVKRVTNPLYLPFMLVIYLKRNKTCIQNGTQIQEQKVLQLTGNKVLPQAQKLHKQLKQMMIRCGIQCQYNQDVVK